MCRLLMLVSKFYNGPVGDQWTQSVLDRSSPIPPYHHCWRKRRGKKGRGQKWRPTKGGWEGKGKGGNGKGGEDKREWREGGWKENGGKGKSWEGKKISPWSAYRVVRSGEKPLKDRPKTRFSSQIFLLGYLLPIPFPIWYVNVFLS